MVCGSGRYRKGRNSTNKRLSNNHGIPWDLLLLEEFSGIGGELGHFKSKDHIWKMKFVQLVSEIKRGVSTDEGGGRCLLKARSD